jgi:hypothetical protein
VGVTRSFGGYTRLSEADKSMMDWMHQYKADTLEMLDPSRQEAYIDDQTAKMNMINSQMPDAISKPKKFIKDGNL